MSDPLSNSTDLGVVQRILARFVETKPAASVEPLRSAGGFSGAEFWRITSSHGVYCLRRWPPEHPDQRRLAAIHQVLGLVFARGVKQIATPKSDQSGSTIVREDGSLWELTDWMPGAANYRASPNPRKLSSALQILARFHLVAAETKADFGKPVSGILARTDQLQRLLAGDFRQLEKQFLNASRFAFGDTQNQIGTSKVSSAARCIAQSCGEFVECFPKVAPRILQHLKQIRPSNIAMQPCIRDIWNDHVLFTDDVVSGLVDFGALRPDHIAGDISRLLGSLVGDDPVGWSAGVAAYEQIRKLSSTDRQLITVYDQSGILLSAMNWMQWIYADARYFDDWDRVQLRCSEIAARLRCLTC